MDRRSVQRRHRALGSTLFAAVVVLAAIAWPGSAGMAEGSSALTELNRQIATTLRTLSTRPQGTSAPHPTVTTAPTLALPDMAPIGGRRFVLPAWAEPFTRASRLLHVRSGDLVFDGWGALRPGGVVRLQYTVRI